MSALNRRTVLFAGAWLAAGCSLTGPAGDYQRGSLPIASGSPGGVYHEYGRQLAYWITRRTAGVSATSEATTGSLDNIGRLIGGRDRIAFVAADALSTMSSGSEQLRALARLYDDYLHLVVTDGSAVRRIGDLRHRRVSIGSIGSGVELVARRVLAMAGLRPSRDFTAYRMGLRGTAEALRTGAIDAFFWSGGLPTDAIDRLALKVPLRLVPIRELVPKLRDRHGAFYRPATIPPAVYLGTDETATLAIPNFLLVLSSLDAGLAYRVTEILFSRRDAIAATVKPADSLEVRTAIQTDPVPLHPGALRYYRSIKP